MPGCFFGAIELLTEKFQPVRWTRSWALTRRGFIFAAPAATKLRPASCPCAKKASLPYKTIEQDYALEYGTGDRCMHVDALKRARGWC